MLSLELARPTGTEMCQQDIRLDNFSSDDIFFSDDFKIDSLQILRLLEDSSGSFSWLIMRYHCFLANRPERFYRSISPEQWLRTVISTQKPRSILLPREQIFEGDENHYYVNEEAGLKILSNVVPRQTFLMRLEGVIATCGGHQCREGFFPTSVLQDRNPLDQSCTECALAKQLRTETDPKRSVVELDKALKFWFLGKTDVEEVKTIKGGSEGVVSTILWRNGTFARKTFPGSDVPDHQNAKFNRELDVALTVSHPNIVHCFGCSRWWDSTDCDLYMEFLQDDLESFLSRLEDMEPPFSFRDSLEMLLQVAEAVKHLHEKKFIHGDLKPGNILLSKLPMHSNVPFYLVKVADFGNTQRINLSGATVEAFDVKIGTHRYTAPEVKRGRRSKNALRTDPEDLQKMQDYQEALQRIDPQKIDVYSFGVVAEEVVAAVTEVEGTSLYDNGLSVLEPFIQRCRAPDLEDRPYFAEICTALSSAIGGDQELRENNAKRRRLSQLGPTFGSEVVCVMAQQQGLQS